MANSIRKLVEQVLAGGAGRPGIPEITDIAVSGDGAMLCQLREGKWIRGRFAGDGEVTQLRRRDSEIGRQAYVYGRQGEHPVAIDVDGDGARGEKGRLHRIDADALRELGFKIPSDGMVQWTVLTGPLEIVLDAEGQATAADSSRV